MRFFLSLLFLCIVNTAFASKGDTVEYYMSYKQERSVPMGAYYYRLAYNEDGLWRVKDFYVAERTLAFSGLYRDSSLSEPMGSHTFYHPNGKLRHKVRYVNGRQDGIVKTYNDVGVLTDSCIYRQGLPVIAHYKWNDAKKVVFKGEYDREATGAGYEWLYFDDGTLSDYGKRSEGHFKDSVWTYYNQSGQICCKEYYEEGNLLKRECYDNGKLMGEDCPDAMPIFQEGRRGFQAVLNKYFNFPDNFRFRGGNTALVVAEVAIDVDGKITDVKLVQKFHPEFDREVLYAFSRVPAQIPAREYNRPVKVKFTMPFKFVMEN